MQKRMKMKKKKKVGVPPVINLFLLLFMANIILNVTFSHSLVKGFHLNRMYWPRKFTSHLLKVWILYSLKRISMHLCACVCINNIQKVQGIYTSLLICSSDKLPMSHETFHTSFSINSPGKIKRRNNLIFCILHSLKF